MSKQIATLVADIRDITGYVLTNPNSDYGPAEIVMRARVGDLAALEKLLSWVYFVTDYRAKTLKVDLTTKERDVFAAAERVDAALYVVALHHDEIAALLAA